MILGLIAGGGDLPRRVCNAADVRLTIALKGSAEPADFPAPSDAFGLAEVKGYTDALRAKGCDHVCMAGYVARPDFATLHVDEKGATYLPHALEAARFGDGHLLRFMADLFEREGFTVIGAQDLVPDILVGKGPLGEHDYQHDDVSKALKIAMSIGRLDIGQGAVVCDGVVLAVEAQEGTDAMLRRIADLPAPLTKPGAVLAKCLKPMQDPRTDMPTIGPDTVRLAAEAGIKAVVVPHNGAIVLDRQQTRRLADAAGLAVIGV